MTLSSPCASQFTALPQKDPSLFDHAETEEAKAEGAEREAFLADLAAKRKFFGGEAYEKSRPAPDTAIFEQGLKLMGKLYGSMWHTTVIQHKTIPNASCANYNNRACNCHRGSNPTDQPGPPLTVRTLCVGRHGPWVVCV